MWWYVVVNAHSLLNIHQNTIKILFKSKIVNYDNILNDNLNQIIERTCLLCLLLKKLLYWILTGKTA